MAGLLVLLWLLRLKKGRRFQPGILSLLPILGLIIVVGVGVSAVIVISELNDGVGNFPVAVGGAELVGSSGKKKKN